MQNTSSKERLLFPNANSLAFKFGLSICILILISMAALSGFSLYHQSQQNNRFLNEFGQVIVKQLAASAQEPLFAQQYHELDTLLNNVTIDHNIISTAIFSHDGELIGSNGRLPSADEIDFEQEYYKLGQTWRFDYLKEPVLVVHTSPISFNDVTAGYALVVFSQEKLYQQMFRKFQVSPWVLSPPLIGKLISLRSHRPLASESST